MDDIVVHRMNAPPEIVHIRIWPDAWHPLCGYLGAKIGRQRQASIKPQDIPAFLNSGCVICPECEKHPRYPMLRLATLDDVPSVYTQADPVRQEGYRYLDRIKL